MGYRLLILFAVLALASAALGQSATLTYDTTWTDGLTYPARLAATPGGGLYVTEQESGSVFELDAAGTLIATHAVAEGPVAIAVHPTNGNVFVSRLDGVVGIYDAAFTQTGLLDPTPFTLTAPGDLAVDAATGEVYVVDPVQRQVLVFDGTTGALVRLWGTEGQGLAELEADQAIALDPALGRVVVADTDNFRIQVYDTTGVLQFKFGYRTAYTESGSTAWVARSAGVAVDSCSNIYVADALMGTVRVFSSAGTDLDINNPAIGYGTNPGELRVPGDVLIEGTTLYVANTNNSSVEVYGLACTSGMRGGTPPAGTEKSNPLGRLTPRTPPMPDNPFDIVTAMRSGTYDRALDLNRDRKVDMRDLEISVAHFGGATVQDFLGTSEGPLDGNHPFDEPPHMHFHEAPMAQYPWICSRCHNMDGAPGDMLTDWGQENLCLSCHSGSRQGGADPIGGDGKGNSHTWGTPAASGDVPGPAAGSDLLLHLDGGDIRCGTCHDPHTSDVGDPYLRVNNDTGGLCKECHRGDLAPQDHGDPYTKYCTDCHDPHGQGDNLHLVKEEFDTWAYGLVNVDFLDDSVGVGPGAYVDPDPDVRGVCEACHDYPSDDPNIVPSHVLDGTMPVCTECHQHHNRFEPGLGPFDPGTYIGATNCGLCHADEAALHIVSGHAHKLNPVSGGPPSYPPEGIYAGVPNPPDTVTWDDVSYVIGGYYRKGRFIDQTGNIYITGPGGSTPGILTQWNLEFPPAGTVPGFVAYEDTRTTPKPYNYSCFQCHTTGPQEVPGGFEDWAEPSVMCEACHGPGSDHAGDPVHVLPVVDTSAAQCGTCHIRGGDPMVIVAKGGYIKHHEQWPELLGSPHDWADCVTCHEPHTSAYYDPGNAILVQCSTCHPSQGLGVHAGETFVRGSYSETLTCESCHMAYATKSAAAADPSVIGPDARMGDIKSHLFLINTDPVDYTAMFTPDGSAVQKDVNGKGKVTLDFACLRCHNGIGNAPAFTLSQASAAAQGYH